jgi:hypothetical protein
MPRSSRQNSQSTFPHTVLLQTYYCYPFLWTAYHLNTDSTKFVRYNLKPQHIVMFVIADLQLFHTT